MSAAHPGLRVSLSRDSSRPLVRVSGELDLATASQLRAHLDELIADPVVSEVWVDLAGVQFCDLTGLSALIGAHQSLAARGGGVVLRRPRPVVTRVLDLLGADLAVEPDPERPVGSPPSSTAG